MFGSKQKKINSLNNSLEDSYKAVKEANDTIAKMKQVEDIRIAEINIHANNRKSFGKEIGQLRADIKLLNLDLENLNKQLTLTEKEKDVLYHSVMKTRGACGGYKKQINALTAENGQLKAEIRLNEDCSVQLLKTVEGLLAGYIYQLKQYQLKKGRRTIIKSETTLLKESQEEATVALLEKLQEAAAYDDGQAAADEVQNEPLA